MWRRYHAHGELPHEGWEVKTDRVWTNNHMAHYTGLRTPALTAKLQQRFSFIFLTERMGFCMLNFFQYLIAEPHSILPAHVKVTTDTLPKRERVNKNTDKRRKNITKQFETVWNMKGAVPPRLVQTKEVWETFKRRNSLDFMLHDLALKHNCSAHQ